MASAVAKRGFSALLKKHCNENPEIVGGACIGVVGLALIVYGVKTYYDRDGDNRRYRTFYTVYRHDDPRVAKLKCSADLTCK